MSQDKVVYLNGLNGLRAIAALAVVIAHVMTPDIAEFDFPYTFRLPMAGFGVTLFFVISGFLITYLLLLEKEKSNGISIRNFYIRRILRIWPIYYLFIGICLIVSFYYQKLNDTASLSVFWYIFFAANVPFILNHGILILVHYWSIGVEEQFYLFWPWVVKSTERKLLVISFLIFIILILVKLGSWYFFGNTSFLYRALTVTRFQCMMVGAIGAILYHTKNKVFTRVCQTYLSQIASWIIFMILGLGILHSPSPLADEIIAVVSLFLIMGQITIKRRIINLDRKAMDFLGKISYGIYVIHPLVIFLLSMTFKSFHLNDLSKYLLVYLLVISLTILLAWLSYEYFEKPFLKLKTRFSTILSANSKYQNDKTEVGKKSWFLRP